MNRMTILLLVLVVVLTIVVSFSAVLNRNKGEIFVWVYRFPTQENRKLIKDLSFMNLDGVFLSVSPLKLDSSRDTFDANYSDKIIDFLRLAQSRRIEVHAVVAEEPTYTYSERHETLLDRVDAILSFNRHHSDSRFVGIQLDVEPYALDEWKEGSWKVRGRLLQQYTELVLKVRERIRSEQSTVLSITVAWWYGNAIAEGKLSSSLVSEFANYVDLFVPLVYNISRNQVTELAKKLEVYFIGSVIIGLRAKDYKDYRTLVDVITDFKKNLESKKSLVGFSIFEYDEFSTIFKRSTPSVSDSIGSPEFIACWNRDNNGNVSHLAQWKVYHTRQP